ncbi:MAG TPA: response regulator transcription factor [Gammaproteobacteria bacterium]|nr:response regulator transcription factor [Gammaproteobacteria bacterium]
MKLLVIEDNPDLVANLRDYFEGAGHQLEAAYNAASGLQTASQGQFDAIVLDLMLPGMDGRELCNQLRLSGHDTPVLMLTARDTLQDKLDGFASGADDYLVKPFALQELEARLKALIHRARGLQGQRQLQVADLELDTETLQLARAGQSIELPRIPLRILTLLMRRAPRIVTRAEIEREIWAGSLPDSDALRAHMHVLRTAIDKPFDEPLLRTVRGVGYRLVDPNVVQA